MEDLRIHPGQGAVDGEAHAPELFGNLNPPAGQGPLLQAPPGGDVLGSQIGDGEADGIVRQPHPGVLDGFTLQPEGVGDHPVGQAHADFRQIPAALRQYPLPHAHGNGVNGEEAVFVRVSMAGAQILSVCVDMIGNPGVIHQEADSAVFLKLFFNGLQSRPILHQAPVVGIGVLLHGLEGQIGIASGLKAQIHLILHPLELAGQGDFLPVVVVFQQGHPRPIQAGDWEAHLGLNGLFPNIQHHGLGLQLGVQPLGIVRAFRPQGIVRGDIGKAAPIFADQGLDGACGVGRHRQGHHQAGGQKDDRQAAAVVLVHTVPFRRGAVSRAFLHKSGVDLVHDLRQSVPAHGSIPSFRKYFLRFSRMRNSRTETRWGVFPRVRAMSVMASA